MQSIEARFFYLEFKTVEDGLRWMHANLRFVTQVLAEAYAGSPPKSSKFKGPEIAKALYKLAVASNGAQLSYLDSQNLGFVSRSGFMFGWTKRDSYPAKFKLGLPLAYAAKPFFPLMVGDLQHNGWTEREEAFGLFRAMIKQPKVHQANVQQPARRAYAGF